MRNTCLDHPSLSIIHAVSFFYTEIPPPKTKFIFSPPTECKLHESKDFVLFISVLGECVISSVLSHHSKDLKGGTVLHLCYSCFIWQAKDSIPSRCEGNSVQFSRSVVSDSLRPHESQHARPPCPSPTPGVH